MAGFRPEADRFEFGTGRVEAEVREQLLERHLGSDMFRIDMATQLAAGIHESYQRVHVVVMG
jgi:ribosome biogenesis SPOUT family RNA methylase Rps3